MRTTTLLLAVLLAGAALAPAHADDSAMSIEEIVALHVEAKGGDAWDDVDGLRMSGEFTAFSEVSPFTLHRARDRRYHIDHTLNGRRVIIGFDDEMPWWDNEWGDGGPQRIVNPVDLAALERDLDFATPFFDYEKRGFELELLPDRDEIEGFPAVAVAVKRPDEQEEVWYLDPDTYLELARESPGSDFGRPLPSLTFFDDFREVEGLMIPHHVETQWYTRDRVMNVAEIEVNPELDESIFDIPPATGMAALLEMVGDWNVKVESKQDPRQPEFEVSSRESSITASLNGGLVEERYASPNGVEARRTFSYDRYREHYVMTQMNSQSTYLDIQTGELGDEGELVVSNVDSGTPAQGFGMTIHERCTISPVADGSFSITRENSIDGGQNWGVVQKLTYTPKNNQPRNP